MKVLLPIDMTNPVDTIIDQVATLLPLSDKTVHLLHVNRKRAHYNGVPGNGVDSCQKALSEAEKMLTGKCLKVTKEIVPGSPAEMIETVARNEDFDLIVLAPGKHPLIEKILLGSVSSKVVKHGQGAIFIVHPLQKYASELRNILIGVDGSANAIKAMLRSVDLFQLNRRDVNVVLLHVVDVSAPIKCISPLEFIYSMEQSLVLDGESFLAESQRLLKDAGVRKVDYALKQGNPAEELFQTARALPADLIIVGAEGHTAVQHFLQGSISHRIAMESPCAVAVIKTRRKDINCAPPLTA